MRVHLSKTRQRGATLVEFILWSVILIAVVALVFTIFLRSKDNRNATTEADMLGVLQASIKELYQGKASYVGLTSAVVTNSAGAPPHMTSGSTLIHSYGGRITLAPISLGSGVNNGYAIVMENMPHDSCAKMVFASGPSFMHVLVGGTVVKQFGVIDMDPATVGNACAATGPLFNLTFASN
jgi:type II secretory pathway pseudopilin PulG